jgi:hypothetical protein
MAAANPVGRVRDRSDLECAMKESARLIIPLWGEVYAQKLVSITLPALLSPGNLPALAEAFDVEVVLVTEARLVDRIRQAPSFRSLSKVCRIRFVSLDDLLTGLSGDYGVVLTYALFRGFTDLGAQMTQTYLLFLNADFIVCDGALRHLAKLMQEGKRVIHAPSFRVVLEDVWPQLQARVDASTAVLCVAPREMVKLALRHKHLTVKARTVNQRLCHQLWMDQFYWYIDEDTLIGYQWPVALVAIKPERAVSEPVLVWDYGFIPEASPTAERHFIDDSDNFFMIEPQKRTTGEELVRVGWISPDEIARALSKWTTKEQRECGRQLLKIHACDLPAHMEDIVAESRAFMTEITRRLPAPQPHIDHGHLSAWFEAAKERMKKSAAPFSPLPAEDVSPPPPENAKPASSTEPAVPSGNLAKRLNRAMLRGLRSVYQTTFGAPPAVGRFHPLWLDTRDVTRKLTDWSEKRARILWLTSRDSLFHTMLQNRVDTTALFLDETSNALFGEAPYDACLCELKPDELPTLHQLHARIRPLMKNGGEVLFFVSARRDRSLCAADMTLCETFPDVDMSEIRFLGSTVSEIFRRIYLRASHSFPGRPIFRAVATGAALIGLAPAVRLANALASRRDPSIFTPRWTSIVVRFVVRKGPATRPAGPLGKAPDLAEQAHAS